MYSFKNINKLHVDINNIFCLKKHYIFKKQKSGIGFAFLQISFMPGLVTNS